MNFSQLNPYIRFSMVITRSTNYTEMLYAYDYRLFYILENTCEFVFRDGHMILEPHDLLIIPPSVGYRIYFQPQVPCRFVLMNFDLDSTCYGTKSVTPVPAEQFDSSQLFSPLRLPPFETIFHRKNIPTLRETLQRICDRSEEESSFFADMNSADLKAILIQGVSAGENGRVVYSELAEQVRKYLDTHFTETPSNEAIAKMFGYHSFYLNRLFSKYFGQTMHAYMNSKKIRAAQQLLLSTDKSIAEIAAMVGFNGAAWFAECFKAQVGVNASDFRRHSR